MNAVRKTATKKRDLVVGLGATGLSFARYLKRTQCDAMFCDTRDTPPGVDALTTLWPDANMLLGARLLPSHVGRLLVSPGIPDTNPLLVAARKAGIEIVTDIELFCRAVSAPVVAVTGSNGKSTVTTLIWQMCRAANRNALAGGNLGVAALDLLAQEPADIYVLELSSFQLQRTQNLPAAVAVLLNIAPDHLDWHASEDEYRRAKYRVLREARAGVINRADPVAKEHAQFLQGVVSFGLDTPEDGQYGIRQIDGKRYLARGETLLLDVKDLALFGVHNQENALAALACAEMLNIGVAAALQVLVEFPGLPHRMQRVRRSASVDYINDSKATNVAAAVASIASIDGMLILIAGGDGKGADFSDLGTALEGKLRGAVLIGRDAKQIAAALDTTLPVTFASDMNDAVSQAADIAKPGDTVLLAPACASLDQYANYMARGDAFIAAVEALTA